MILCSIVVSLYWESQYKVIASLACMLRQSFMKPANVYL